MVRKPSPADHEAARRLLGTEEDRAAADRLLAPKQGFPATDVQGTGYCVQCRRQRNLQNVKRVGGRLEGICTECGAIVFNLLRPALWSQWIGI